VRGTAADLLATIAGSALELVDRFTLPDEAWWDDFYTPMRQGVLELRQVHAADPAAFAVLEQIGKEPELHRRYSEYYPYISS
jgi:hypothetical protein